MKAYIYLDNDRNLSYRDGQTIDEYYPDFWQNNAHIIDTVWVIDTEDNDSIVKMLTSFKKLELPVSTVRDLCKVINFDLDLFLRKASSK